VNDCPAPAPGDQHPTAGEEEAGRWREAARLRRDHAGWVIIWHAPAGQFRAYGRLPGARRDTALTAPTPARLADLIGQAEQARPAARATARRPNDPEDPA
jgi:hypothetical protein